MDYKNRPERCLYHHFMVHHNMRKYFCFVMNMVTYQFKVLPFDLSTAPWEFTKMLAPVLHPFRSQGIRVHAYLDDWIIRVDSRAQTSTHAQQTIKLLQSLGWTIYWQKSTNSLTKMNFWAYISIYKHQWFLHPHCSNGHHRYLLSFGVR